MSDITSPTRAGHRTRGGKRPARPLHAGPTAARHAHARHDRALALIWTVFHVLSGGLFLTPRNLWNLSVQSASVSVMATGMVLVIVTRNIDLSVGSLLGVTGMIIGVTQRRSCRNIWASAILPSDSSPSWPGWSPASLSARCRGYIHRLSESSCVHRHAGRASRVARRRLVEDQRPHGRADGFDIPPARRRARRGHRRHRELDFRHPRLHRHPFP